MLLPYGATAQAGIIVEGDAVVIDYIAVTLEIPTQSYLTDVAPHLDVCSRFQSEDSTAALTTDKFLAQSAFNSPLLLRGAGQSQLTGYQIDGVLAKSCTFGHLPIGQIWVLHLYKGPGIVIPTRAVFLSKSEKTGMAADSAFRAAKMGGYLMDIIGMKVFLEYIVVLFSPYGSLCLKPGSIALLDMVQFFS